MADLIKFWLYPNVAPRIWLSQIYLWKDKIMKYLFIFISLKDVFMRDNTWRDKIMRHLLMLICFKRCLIWNDPTARRKRKEKALRIPRQKCHVSWDFLCEIILHASSWCHMDRGTYHLGLAYISDGLMAVGCKMERERREEEKRCFMKQHFTLLFVKI